MSNKLLDDYTKEHGHKVFYHNAPVHWHKFFDFIPYYSENGIKKQSSHLKTICFANKNYSYIVICVCNSSLFYWYNWQYSNCRDLSIKDIVQFPITLDGIDSELINNLSSLSTLLMKDFKQKSKIYKRVSNGHLTKFDSFYPMYSKPIINEIDKILAKHYGFTDEELDFIINYDIKYRMGSELEGGDG
jgi:hypothetical protein